MGKDWLTTGIACPWRVHPLQRSNPLAVLRLPMHVRKHTPGQTEIVFSGMSGILYDVRLYTMQVPNQGRKREKKKKKKKKCDPYSLHCTADTRCQMLLKKAADWEAYAPAFSTAVHFFPVHLPLTCCVAWCRLLGSKLSGPILIINTGLFRLSAYRAIPYLSAVASWTSIVAIGLMFLELKRSEPKCQNMTPIFLFLFFLSFFLYFYPGSLEDISTNYCPAHRIPIPLDPASLYRIVTRPILTTWTGIMSSLMLIIIPTLPSYRKPSRKNKNTIAHLLAAPSSN